MNILTLLTAGLFSLAVMAFVLAWAFPVWPGDECVLVAVQGWRSPALDVVFRMLTYLGWYPVAVALTLVAMVLLLAQRRRVDALLLGIVVSSALLTHPLKVLLGRPRPDYAIIEPIPHGMGFPSGHATFAILMGGMVIYLAWRYTASTRVRWGMAAGLALLILGVGLSRVYLGVHWPSDVLGGYLFGGTILLVAAWLRDWVTVRRGQRSGENTTL